MKDIQPAMGQALLLLVGFWVVACGVIGTGQVTRGVGPGGALAPVAVDGTDRTPGATRITVYLPRLFEDGSLGLRAVARDVMPSSDPARDALESLIRGPDGNERAADFQYALDRRTRVVSTRLEGRTAVVELGDQIRRVHGRPFSELAYWSLVYTLTDVPGVERVSLQRGGQPLAELGDPPFSVPAVGRAADAPSWARPR